MTIVGSHIRSKWSVDKPNLLEIQNFFDQIIFDPSESHEPIFGTAQGSLTSVELLLIELFKRLMFKRLSTNEKECALLLMLIVIITLTLATSKLNNLSDAAKSYQNSGFLQRALFS